MKLFPAKYWLSSYSSMHSWPSSILFGLQAIKSILRLVLLLSYNRPCNASLLSSYMHYIPVNLLKSLCRVFDSSFWSQGSVLSTTVAFSSPSCLINYSTFNAPALGSKLSNIFALLPLLSVMEILIYCRNSENYCNVSGISLVS